VKQYTVLIVGLLRGCSRPHAYGNGDFNLSSTDCWAMGIIPSSSRQKNKGRQWYRARKKPAKREKKTL